MRAVLHDAFFHYKSQQSKVRCTNHLLYVKCVLSDYMKNFKRK